jgi:hypothetical protein
MQHDSMDCARASGGTQRELPTSEERRNFILRGATAATVTAGSVVLHPLLGGPSGTAEAAEISPDLPHHRVEEAFRLRVQAAEAERRRGVFPHPTNGDEERYPTRIANFHKTLPHNSIGEVDPDAYRALLRALRSGRFADFEAIPTGGTGRLANPLGGLVFNMEGPDSPAVPVFAIPPALASGEKAAEMAELYWEAYLRDVPFADYPTNRVVHEACADLTRMRGYRGPRNAQGRVTPQLLFRYNFPGALDGPMVSQFLYANFSFDGIPITPLMRTRRKVLNWTPDGSFAFDTGLDYLTAFDEWLTSQNGNSTGAADVFTTPRLINSVRDLGQIAMSDIIYSVSFRAALVLNGLGVPVDDGNPYKSSSRQVGFSTFGLAHLVNLIGATQKAERHTWYQKWFVHRHARPDAWGGLVDNRMRGRAPYPLHGDLLNSPVMERISAYNRQLNSTRFGTSEASFLLPMMSPGGSPSHPSAPAGHAIAAGAGATMLKAWFQEDFVLPDSVTVQLDRDGNIIPYRAGVDGPPLTVGGELNKLAHNLSEGRNMSGVHWRISDNVNGLLHGEEVVIRILSEAKHTYPEPNARFTLTKFDGKTITI